MAILKPLPFLHEFEISQPPADPAQNGVSEWGAFLQAAQWRKSGAANAT